jgi:PIN domain nuclease of toxin-antitoxin system
MRALIDTHVFLWFITSDPRLSPSARQIISAGSNEVLLSVASVWEVAIKASTGRLPLPAPVDQLVPQQLRINRIGLLPIEPRHVYEVVGLPFHHRDPFDRLLIAQAISEGVPLVSADTAFDAYPVQRLW